MTSNLGAEFLLSDPFTNGELQQETRDKVMQKVRKTFRPELLNRLDDIIIFTPLNKNNLGAIVTNAISRIQKRLTDRHIQLKLNQSAIDFILKESWNPIYGARVVNRFVEKHLVTEISKLIVAGTILDYSDVLISAENSQLKFKVEKLSQPAENSQQDEQEQQQQFQIPSPKQGSKSKSDLGEESNNGRTKKAKKNETGRMDID